MNSYRRCPPSPVVGAASVVVLMVVTWLPAVYAQSSDTQSTDLQQLSEKLQRLESEMDFSGEDV